MSQPATKVEDKKCVLNHEISHKPDYAFLDVQIPAEQKIMVEGSAMATMSPNMKMKTKMKGGLGRILTGESLFINEFTAEGTAGSMGIAPAVPGDMDHVFIDGETVFLQGSSYVASTPEVNVETKFQGIGKGFFSGESLFFIKCSGKGDLWFNTYGGMLAIDVKDDFVVDTGYVVGFTEGLEYKVESVGGMKSLFFSGEGLVCRFKGQGKLWIQTRQAPSFVSWVNPFRPVKSKS